MSGTARGRLKLVILLGTLLLVFAAACGEEAPETDTGGGGEDAGAGFETIEEGTLTVGSCLDYRPFEFVKDGEEQGFDVEVVEAIAEKLNLEVQWKKANFDTIFTAQAANKFDMVAAASTILPEREEIVEAIDTDEKYGFAFSKDNPELTEAANGALQEIIDEGTYADIFSK
ncbi:MAG: transporter substrate-binding domain-containing protein, partial [Actinomycetota bacterium]|nr:transporter substrate-binding domain-containing protein [Actinomycetota bacterium]